MSKTVSPRQDVTVDPAASGDAHDASVLGQAPVDGAGQSSETRLQRQLRLAHKVLIEQADALRELAKH